MSIKTYTSSKTGIVTYKVELKRKKNGRIIESKYQVFSTLEKARAYQDLVRAYWKNQLHLLSEVTECSTLNEAVIFFKEFVDYGFTSLGKTERSNLSVLTKEATELNKASPLRDTMLMDLDEDSIMDFCEWRRGPSRENPDVDPQTTYNNLSTLKMLLEFLKLKISLNISTDFLKDSNLWTRLKRDKLACKSKPRNIRPKGSELEAIYHLLSEKEKSNRTSIPYTLMFLMTLSTGLRISELTNLMAEDIDAEENFIWLRKYKGDHGLESRENWVQQPLVRGSLELLQSYIDSNQITSGRIFSFTAGGVTKAFRNVLVELGIENLRWHDLRREAISQLIELQISKQLAKTVSRHKDDSTFDKNYCHPSMKIINDAVPVLKEHPKMSFLQAVS